MKSKNLDTSTAMSVKHKMIEAVANFALQLKEKAEQMQAKCGILLKVQQTPVNAGNPKLQS
jgi:hypothetical protein